MLVLISIIVTVFTLFTILSFEFDSSISAIKSYSNLVKGTGKGSVNFYQWRDSKGRFCKAPSASLLKALNVRDMYNYVVLSRDSEKEMIEMIYKQGITP